jgi:hypothetical protein
VKFYRNNQTFTIKSFGIQNLEVEVFRDMEYRENERKKFRTLKDVRISEVSGIGKFVNSKVTHDCIYHGSSEGPI